MHVYARVPALARTFAEIGDVSVTYKKLKGMPAGKLLSVTELRELWGFAAQDIKAFRQIAAEEGIVIGIRGRSPASVKNLEEGAVYKHEAVKPKNVNDIDRLLGFPRRRDTSPVGPRCRNTLANRKTWRRPRPINVAASETPIRSSTKSRRTFIRSISERLIKITVIGRQLPIRFENRGE